MKTLGIIPARYASVRFPGKPLAKIGEKTMIERVYEQARQTALLNGVIVATDDYRIFDHVRNFGGNVIMTRPDHTSGTDRCAEVAAQIPGYDLIINIQGDEPFVAPEQIDAVIALLQKGAPITTLAKKINKSEALKNLNIVKVLLDEQGKALNFSRQALAPAGEDHYKHIGLYGFQRAILEQITKLPPSPREQEESLEQLRWLEHGYDIIVGITNLETISIDTPEDLTKLKI